MRVLVDDDDVRYAILGDDVRYAIERKAVLILLIALVTTTHSLASPDHHDDFSSRVSAISTARAESANKVAISSS
eukprot:7044295-Pyramimonas_sp.AAC.1